MLDLSRLLDSNSREALGQVITTVQSLVSDLARFRETGVVDHEGFLRELWELRQDLSNCAGDMRKQLVVNDGESDGLFCQWNDTTGMQIWKLLTAIKDAGEAIEEVAYWFARILEDADQSPEDVSNSAI